MNPTSTPPGPLGKGEGELRERFRTAVGGDEVSFTDPTGEKVLVTQALVDHMLEMPHRQRDGREAYFPFIRELIEDPEEIWVNFRVNADNEKTGEKGSGRIDMRKRYVKGLQLRDGKTVGLIAESGNNLWVGLTFFDKGPKGMNNLRRGRLLYARGKT